MSSIREQIIAAAVLALNTGAPAVDGWPIAERARQKAISSANVQKILVYGGIDIASDVGGKAGPIIERAFELIVECISIETESAIADTANDPLVCWVVKALTENKLGGLVHSLREDNTDTVLRIAQVAFCHSTVTLVVKYHHKAGDLEQSS